MPELPEVETTLRGLKPHILGQKIVDVIIRKPHLRWPIPRDLKTQICGYILHSMTRRGKYLLFEFETGTLILHLGMSGHLRLSQNAPPAQKHDHVDIIFANEFLLRLNDPRRFGALLFTLEKNTHPLLTKIGIEPLTAAFNADYLFTRARNRKMPVKSFIMDSHIVAGVGNIYATEALFQARILPQKAAGKVTHAQYQKLCEAIKAVLKAAIKKGGTTLKDFKKSDGTPGYFDVALHVYGKENKPCPRCKETLQALRLSGRSTVYCNKCQR